MLLKHGKNNGIAVHSQVDYFEGDGTKIRLRQHFFLGLVQEFDSSGMEE
jgi:hypothetical protein